jgi:ParB family chromosome partitioning protein
MPAPKRSLGRGLDKLISGSLKTAANAQPPRPPTTANTAPTAAGTTPTPDAATSSTNAPSPANAPSSAAPAAAPPAHDAPTAFPLQEIPVSKIVPARWQARREFDEQALSELADSILTEGLLQPVVVRKTSEGYELIAGERRWRAFKKLALKTIPARLVTASDASTAVMTLIENLQREGLNSVEEAVGFASLMRDFNLTQEAVAERVGKPRATVANSVRLLSLDREIQGYLAKGMLSTGHAKVILGLENDAERALVARRIVESGASVREAEAIVKKFKDARPATKGATAATTNVTPTEILSAISDIEKRLTACLNTKVRVKHGARQGRILIEYYGNDDLRRILEKIGGPA